MSYQYPGQTYGSGGYHQAAAPHYGGYAQPPPNQGYGQYPQQGYGQQPAPQHQQSHSGQYPPRQQRHGLPPPPQHEDEYGNLKAGHQSGYGGHGSTRDAPPPPSGVQEFGHGAPSGYTFQYSNCTGKRKALLIGINYFGQKGELRGCINDVRNVSEFLETQYHYRPEDMIKLTDDNPNPMNQPTKENIIRAMQWLVRDAQPNDSLFLHYSGHGGQTEDLDGDEEDGYDEVIYPVDFKSAGHIVDDEIHYHVVKPLAPGVRLTAIFDSCHSGSVLDLPYIYSTKGILKEPNLAKEAGQGLLEAAGHYARGDVASALGSVFSIAKTALKGDDAYEHTKRTKTSPADVIMWSGSKDDQTS